jgi:hypothetical protein
VLESDLLGKVFAAPEPDRSRAKRSGAGAFDLGLLTSACLEIQ